MQNERQQHNMLLRSFTITLCLHNFYFVFSIFSKFFSIWQQNRYLSFGLAFIFNRKEIFRAIASLITREQSRIAFAIIPFIIEIKIDMFD